LSCYYQYVIPAIRKMQGAENPALHNFMLPLLQDIKNTSGKTLYAPARITNEGIEPLTGKGSHALQSYAMANAVIELPPEPQELKVGTSVLVHMLPS
jgi:molybdopterin molybdotransferase